MASARALLYGRRTYELMESAWRRPATGEWPEWMGERDIRFTEVIDTKPKHVVSSTLTAPDWQAELVSRSIRWASTSRRRWRSSWCAGTRS